MGSEQLLGLPALAEEQCSDCKGPAEAGTGNSSSQGSAVAIAAQKAATPPAAGAGKEAETDLATTVAAALRHSAVVRRAQADLAGAAVGVKLSQTGYQPEIQSSAGLGTSETYDYQLTVSQPLYDWGRTGADVDRARAQRLAAEADLSQAAENTALEAVQAHIAVHRSEKMVRIAQENVVAHQRFTRIARDRSHGGVGNATEVELAGVREGEAESEMEDARGDLRNAYSIYYSRVGREPKSLAPVSELPLYLGEGDLESAALSAPGVLAARAREDAALSSANVERSDMLPKLKAEAFVRGEDDSDLKTGLGLRIVGPTIAGLSNFHRVEAANLQADSAKWAAEAARREATILARQLYDHEPTLRARIRILSEQLQRARSLRDLYEDQFKIGQRSIADLVNSQTDVFRIQRSLLNARYEIIDLQYQAAAALGYLTDSLQVNVAGGK